MIKNEELKREQKRLKHIEQMLDTFRRNFVVLGRNEASEEVPLCCEELDPQHQHEACNMTALARLRTVQFRRLVRRSQYNHGDLTKSHMRDPSSNSCDTRLEVS